MKQNYVIAKPNQHSASIACVGNNENQTLSTAVDPLSTPARRRRIIADVARFLLKQYCTKACINVKRFRLETKSSMAIQCSFRCHAAIAVYRKLLHEKRVRAAWIIQCAFRIYMAKRFYNLLSLQYRRLIAIRIAIFCQKYWRGIMARRKYLKLLNAQKQFLARRKRIAATLIQANTRGLLGRLYASILRKKRDRIRRLKWISAIKIQSIMRRDIAFRKVIIYRQILLTRNHFYFKWVSLWYIRRKHKFDSIVLIQRYWRVKLARIKLKLLKIEKIKNDELERLRLQALNAAKVAIPEPPALEIRVTINLDLLRHMAALGPAEVIKWCLQNFVLYYHTELGYSLGPVLNQVVNAVDKVMPSIHDEVQEENSIIPVKDINDLVLDNICEEFSVLNEKTRSVELEKWDTGNEKTISDIPMFDHLPQRWNQKIQLDQGASISVEIKQKAIELHVKLNVDVHQRVTVASGSVSLPKLSSFTSKSDRSIHLMLVLEAVDVNDMGTTAIITPADGIQLVDLMSLFPLVASGSPLTPNNGNFDVRFYFKNAIVFVAVHEIVPPPPEIYQVNSEVTIITPTVPEIVPIVPDIVPVIVTERPVSRAKIILTVPDEPIIDYDSFASRIQRGYKRWHIVRVNACQCIKQVLKRIHLLYRWRVIVNVVLKLAIAAALMIQCRIRCHKAKLKAIKMREHRCNSYLELIDRIVQLDFENEKEIVYRIDTVSSLSHNKMISSVAITPDGFSCLWGQSVFKILQIRESIPGCVNPTEDLFLADPNYVHNDSNYGDIVSDMSTIEMCSNTDHMLPSKEAEGLIFPPVFRSIAKEFSD